MTLVWCLTPEEEKDFALQEEMYNNLWSKADFNCKTSPKTNINKELERENQTLTNEERQVFIVRKLTYLFEMYDKTAFPWTEEQFDEKLKQAYGRWCRIQFQHMQDNKFRHGPSKWLFVWEFLPLIMEIMEKKPNLKEFVFGEENMNFQFSDLYLEAKNQFNQYHMTQITRTEMHINIEFDSIWTIFTEIYKYVLGTQDDKTIPLNDPFKKYV